MTKLTITFRDGRPDEIEIDGDKKLIDAFLLLTNVPSTPPCGHRIAFGNSHKMGEMIFNLWHDCVTKDPAGAFVLESVAKDIISQATRTRGAAWYATEEGVTN